VPTCENELNEALFLRAGTTVPESDTVMRILILRITLGTIAAFQIVFGSLFLFAPHYYGSLVGLPEIPDWAGWIFAMFGARAFGFAAGLILAMRDPHRHRAWIGIMIGVQALDLAATVAVVATGAITASQASTALFMPAVFVIALWATFPRSTSRAPALPRLAEKVSV